MWINKKRYEDLQFDIIKLENRIDNLVEVVSKQERCINKLNDIHGLYALDCYSVDKGGYCRFNKNVHSEPTATIGDIDNLTFTELAEYVINGKPITRVREHEVVVCPKEDENDE